jgi:hypothetical protein
LAFLLCNQGYGRLSSYTFIDQLFGGHLLSSIVCEECKTCLQRVEPFLDLSLPIVDESRSKETHWGENSATAAMSNRFRRGGGNKQSAAVVPWIKHAANYQLAESQKKNAKSTATSDKAASFLKKQTSENQSPDPSQMSKHQMKKLKKTSKKANKV